mgnify:CR=1 FL=1
MAFQILTMDYWENLYNKVTKEVLPILSIIFNPFENFRLLSCKYERLCETRNQMKTTLICMKETTRFHVFDRKTFFETKYLFMYPLTALYKAAVSCANPSLTGYESSWRLVCVLLCHHHILLFILPAESCLGCGIFVLRKRDAINRAGGR